MNKTSLLDIINKNIVVVRGFGDIAYLSDCSVYANIIGEINKINNTANIHIQVRIMKNNGSNTQYQWLSVSKIANALGYSSMTWSHINTRVVPIYQPNLASSKVYDYEGYTGCLLEPTDGGQCASLSRVYQENGAVGAWQHSIPLYDAGSMYAIDIYGAVLS